MTVVHIQFSRTFSLGTLNCMDVLYYPITHPCNSRYWGKIFLYMNHNHMEYLYNLLSPIHNKMIMKQCDKNQMFAYFLFFGDTLTLNDIPYGGHVRVHIVNGPISDESKLSTHQQLLTDRSIYLSVLHMIWQLEMNDRLHDTTSNRILLDANVSPNNFV